MLITVNSPGAAAAISPIAAVLLSYQLSFGKLSVK